MLRILCDDFITWLLQRKLAGEDQESSRAVMDDSSLFCRTGKDCLRDRRVIWMHGASIGEVKCLLPLIDGVISKGYCDTVLLSYTSPDALLEARRWLKRSQPVLTLPLFYVPFRKVRSAVQAADLRLAVVAEGDLWPKMVAICRSLGSRILVIDVNMHANGIFGKWLTRSKLNQCHLLCVQHNIDKAKLKEIGVSTRILVTGVSKAKESWQRAELAGELRKKYLDQFNLHERGPVLVFGSIVEKELQPMMRIVSWFVKRYPKGMAIIAPRHVRKRAVVEKAERILRNRGIRFCGSKDILGGQVLGSPCNCEAILIDQMGFLAELYSVADVAIIGGTFCGRRGHNVLEPISMGVPVICGKRWGNATQLYREFEQMQLLHVAELGQITVHLETLLANRRNSEVRFQRASTILAEMAKTPERHLSVIEEMMKESKISPVL